MDDDEPSGRPPATLRRLHLTLAWVVILAVAALFMLAAPTAEQAAVEAVAADDQVPQIDPLDDQLLAAQLAVGLRGLGQAAAVDPEEVVTQVEAAADDPLEAWRSAVVAGELLGAEAGRDRLAAMELAGHPEVATDVALLYQIYLDGVEAVSPEDRHRLRRRHGWFGGLALTHGLEPEAPQRAALVQDAIRTAIVLALLSLVVLGLLLGGAVTAILAVLTLRSGRLEPAYRADPTAPVAYASAFALYLLSFLAFSGAIGLITQQLDLGSGALWLLWLFPLVFAPLLLGWLRLAGHEPRRALRSMGLHRGRGLWREAGAGIVGYLAGIPLVLLGFIITAMLANGGGSGMDHPVVDELRRGGLGTILGALLLGSLFAPVVEETMFRGVLYHHLRAWYGPPLAALLQGVVFAAVHPQGLAAIPVLAALGIVFAFIREWRGSLIGPMVAHGLHNGGTMAITILLLS
jgi:membrane protease YdiL (CAAX protease family)